MKLILAVALAGLAVSPATAAAHSPFEWRGIVEGAYGPTWTHQQRARIVRWMPQHGFNAYVHAPKDDLFQRTNWRDPYPAAQQREFDAEIAAARKRGVEWIPNLSPAQPLLPTPAVPSTPPSRDLCFSCASDLQVVRRKLAPFVDAGSRTVMISFDDVTKVMTNPEDLATYGTGDEAFGRANGAFLTRLRDSYGGKVRVLTVGADYSGTQDTAYLRGLRATLASGIDVMWTGDAIPSAPFTAADATAYGRAIGRTPLVWDNWTDNDTAGNVTPHGAARIFLGPYSRSAKVTDAVGGFFFNPMNEAGLNELPLATAGDWMRSPRAYRPRRSWLRAVRELAGRSRARRQALRAWAETSWSNKLEAQDAPTFARLTRGFLSAYGSAPGAWPRVRRALQLELRLAKRPLGKSFFTEQAGPWVEAARSASTAGGLGTRLLAAERPMLRVRRTRRGFRGMARPPDPNRVSALRAAHDQASRTWETSTRFVYGWRGGIAFELPPYPVPGNLMDGYEDSVDALDRAWQPTAQQAAASVTVTLGGRRIGVDGRGRFVLPRKAAGRTLVATDGAGAATAVRLRRTAPGSRRRVSLAVPRSRSQSHT